MDNTIFIVTITLCNKEVITKEMSGKDLKTMRKSVWTMGISKPLPGGKTEWVSPYIINQIIVEPKK